MTPPAVVDERRSIKRRLRSPEEWQTFGSWRYRTVVWGVLVGAVAVVVYAFDGGWLPHDDGYLAWSAERVLNGETPHVDYDEIYTGGLSYLNAASFRVWGPSLLALRYSLLGLFVAFVLCIFAICRRGTSPLVAAATTAIVVCLGPLLTPTPMPTLYNLYLGVMALYCFVRFVEKQAVWWLALAGFLTGLSLLVKVSGLYVLMGIAIAVVAVTPRLTAYDRVVRRTALIGAGASATLLIASGMTLSRLVAILLPIYLMIWVVARTDAWPEVKTPSVAALSALSLGFLVPVISYAGYFAARGHLADLLAGVTQMITAVAGQLHFDTKPLATLLVPAGLMVIVALLSRLTHERGARVEVGVVVIFVLAWYVLHPRSILLAIHTVGSWIVVIASVLVWWRVRSVRSSVWSRRLAIVVLCVGASFQLVKFPSANQWQVAYTVPLGVVVVMLIARELPRQARVGLLSCLVAFAAVFALARLNGQIYSSTTVGLSVPYIELESNRARIQVPMVHWYYNEVNAAIEDDAKLFATPDLPEVYFLNGQPGSGRGVFPVLSQAIRPGDSEVSNFEEADADVVVIDTNPVVSTPDAALERRVAADCGSGTLIGRLLLFEC